MRTRRDDDNPGSDAGLQGRLTARPTLPTDRGLAGSSGLQPLGLGTGSDRDGLWYVPSGYRADRPAPLILMLHGAGGAARSGLAPFLSLADAAGTILLAPDSRGRTWDVILDEYGPDGVFINAALTQTFARYAIDAAHIAAEGFSDGASYALSLGLMNGDLFTHVIAFSPGFATPATRQGMPRLFVSHGTRDAVLPIDRCSRRIVPQFERAGYDVRYTEFDGPHIVPPEIASDSLAWFLGESV